MIYAVYSLLAIHLHIPTRSAVAPSRVSLPVAVASPFDTLSNRRTSFSSDDASGALSYEELVALERQTDALYQKEMLSGVYDERRRCFAITGGAKRYSITSTCFALLALDAEPERWHSAAAGRASARLDHLQVDAVLEALLVAGLWDEVGELLDEAGPLDAPHLRPPFRTWLAGVGALAVGAYFTVFSTERIVSALGIPNIVGGLFITAAVASLPEVFTTWSVARSGQGTSASTSVIGDHVVTMTLAFIPLTIIGTPIENFQLFWVSLAFVVLMAALYALFLSLGDEEKRGFGRWHIFAFWAANAAFIAVIFLWVKPLQVSGGAG